jgi:two-component system sensor histidine kinase and response regulator WspE
VSPGPDASLWELYRGEVETHARALGDGLLELEIRPDDQERIRALLRAAHSIKGAARVVRHAPAADLAAAIEARLARAQGGEAPLTPDAVRDVLEAVDLLVRLSPPDEREREPQVDAARQDVARIAGALASAGAAPTPTPQTATPTPTPQTEAPGTAAPGPAAPALVPPPADAAGAVPGAPRSDPESTDAPPAEDASAPDRSIRVPARVVSRMVGLAGEALVGMRGLEPFRRRLLGLKRTVADLVRETERDAEPLGGAPGARNAAGLRPLTGRLHARLEEVRAELTDMTAALDAFLLRHDALATRLFEEVRATRMRPFADTVEPLRRLSRDLARELGKRVTLAVEGRAVPVDRDVAALLEAPVIHALRNAIDHGIEPPAERRRAGKPETGTITLRARHRAGMLCVDISDDGRGVDLDDLRRRIVERNLAGAEMAGRLGDEELLAFLLLPGFTTRTEVTDVSGRGVGLDVMATAVRSIDGRLRLRNHPGGGLTIRIEVPVTLSVLAALIVEIAGEPYAFPITRVERVEVVPADDIRESGGRAWFTVTTWTHVDDPAPESGVVGPRHVGVAGARQVLELPGDPPSSDRVPIVVLRRRESLVGLAVDRVAGERSVIVRPLDARLGRVRHVTAGGLLADGEPVLVLDEDDVGRSIEDVLAGGFSRPVGAEETPGADARKRVLVVDDSITVREVERQLLEGHGYEVDVAQDGAEAWHAIRGGRYDLVITDLDMPRLDGLELLRRIRGDRRLGAVPVIVVSYKDGDADRRLGIEAGATRYLTKASFRDDTFLRAVDELLRGAA